MVLKGSNKVRGYSYVSTGVCNYTTIATQPGQVYGVQAFNLSTAAPAYVKLYDSTAVSSVTSTTSTVPLWQSGVPIGVVGSTGAGGVAQGGVIDVPFPAGLQFSSGLSFSIVGGIALNSTVAVAADTVLLNVQFETAS